MRLTFFSTAIRHFLAVAEAGSVNRAAGQLHVAASAVSRQIGKLEDEMGMPLFERSAQGMVPTEAGYGLLAHVRASHEEVAQVTRRLQGLSEQAGRQVRLACTEGFAAEFMPVVLDGFRRAHPEAEIDLFVGNPEEVSTRMQRGDADLGLCYLLKPEPGITVLYSMRAPLYALMRPVHPLAGRGKVALAEVVRYPLAVGARGMTGRQMVDMACSVQGLQYRTAMVCNFSSALLPLLRDQDILLAGYHTGVRHIREGRLVALGFSDTQLRQRHLQLLAPEGRKLTALQQVLAQTLETSLGSYVSKKTRKAG